MELLLAIFSLPSLLIFLAVLVGSFLVLYILYRICMRIQRRHLNNKYSWYQYLWIVPIVVIGYIWDIYVNYVWATLLMWEFPLSWREEKTVSERLTRYKLTDCGWRSKYTAWIGPKLLDKWTLKEYI